jgi:anaerobic dimethyl sulfoxide reductase subunit B (iron-sulfur subunit)
MAKYGWLVDLKRCIECRACESACKQWNQVATGVGIRYRIVRTSEAGVYPKVATQAASLACNHCDEAWCIKVCTVKAISRRADGVVLIDSNKCFGCRECEKFCPYQQIFFNATSNKVEKCTMCADRIDQGLAPACATLCPTDALQWGEWSQIQDKGVGAIPGFTDPQYTKPNIRFIVGDWPKK